MAGEKAYGHEHVESVPGGGHMLDEVPDRKHLHDLEETELAVIELSPEEEKRVLRKVDFWLVPQLTILYLMAFLDRSNSKPFLCRGSSCKH